jgi:hypothetical protein
LQASTEQLSQKEYNVSLGTVLFDTYPEIVK